MTNAYIFLCSNATEDECIDKLLFGGTSSYQSKVRQVNIGDILFLYNYKTGRLHGVFRAISKSAMNIVPDAWKAQYPWQVKVEIEQEFPHLSRADFETFIPINKGMPQAKLLPEQLEKLLEKFKSAKRLPPQEIDYRNDNLANIWTKDRHKVRSMSEVTIDDWLFEQKIAHGYEGEIKLDKDEIFCDFFIPTEKKGKYIYIEFWGLDEEKYNKRKEYKKNIYKQGNLKLIELYPKDLENLDSVLIKNLKEYGL